MVSVLHTRPKDHGPGDKANRQVYNTIAGVIEAYKILNFSNILLISVDLAKETMAKMTTQPRD